MKLLERTTQELGEDNINVLLGGLQHLTRNMCQVSQHSVLACTFATDRGPDEKERPKIVLICISKRSAGKENDARKVIERDQTGQFHTVTDTDWRLLVAHKEELTSSTCISSGQESDLQCKLASLIPLGRQELVELYISPQAANILGLIARASPLACSRVLYKTQSRTPVPDFCARDIADQG